MKHSLIVPLKLSSDSASNFINKSNQKLRQVLCSGELEITPNSCF